MKKVKIICIMIIVVLIIGSAIYLINNNNKELANIHDVKTDAKFENITYDKVEDVWDDSVLGILTIEKIGLKATVKEGTTDEILLNYNNYLKFKRQIERMQVLQMRSVQK